MPTSTIHCHQSLILENIYRLSIDKIQKCRAEEFRGKVDDDPARDEYWLEHTQSFG